MKKLEHKVPNLRFKGFTNDWEQHKLGDVVNLIGGGPFKSTDSVSKGIPWLKIANVGVNGITWNTESYLPEYFWNDYPQYQLKKGNYVVALTRPILNHRLKISKLDRDALLNQRVAKLTTSENLQYIVHLLERKKVVLQIENNLSGSDPPNLSSKDLYRIKIKIPSESNEQKQIGTFLTKLDSIISLQQRKLELLKEIKKGLLQKMFADKSKFPILRFEGFHDEWEQQKFSELYIKSNKKNDLSYKKNKVISVATMSWSCAPQKSKDNYMKTYNVVHKGDIVFEGHKSDNFQFGRFVENTIGDGIVSHIYDVYSPTKKRNLLFWKYYINSEKVMRNILRMSTTSARMMHNLVSKDIANQILNVPSHSEQLKIGKIISLVQSTIYLQQQKLAKYQSIKKSLLQQMFI